MNIGFVSTWLERGATYVTKAYIDLLKENHNIFVYARGGEEFAKNDPKWNLPEVTWGLRLYGTSINFNHIKKWIKKNNIEIIFFNEQHEVEIVFKVKEHFPNIKIGSYIDYYKEDTVKEFLIYDFLICNTKRHYSVFRHHPQCYYVPWGTDTELFKPRNNKNKTITFFHSSGMSVRKGTKLLVDSFIDGKLYNDSKLIIHSQLDFNKTFGYNPKELKKYNIDIIEKTVTAPGIYYLGDVYVYPTYLDGLGLTIYEALSCGLPVITTNNAPMNEVINEKVGYLVDVSYYRARSDAYYWPLSICEKNSLIEGMLYFVKNKSSLDTFKKNARMAAVEKWNWTDRQRIINDIFVNTKILNQSIRYNNMTHLNVIERLTRKLGSSYVYHLVKSIRNK